MSLQNASTESALARCPIEVWEQILTAVVYASRKPLTSKRGAISLDRYRNRVEYYGYITEAYQPHTTAWTAWYEDIRFAVDISSKRTVNSFDWSHRLVCKAWNRLLLPLLLQTVRVHKDYTQLEKTLAMLGTDVGGHTLGYFVRRLLVHVMYFQDWDVKEPDDKTATSLMSRLFELCPRLQDVRYVEDVILPSTDLSARYFSNVKRLAMGCGMTIDTNTLLDFCASLPCLEELDITSYHNTGPTETGGRRPCLSSLTHLAVSSTDSDEFLVYLASCDFPSLKHIFLADAYRADMSGAMPLLQAHGINLRSVVFAHLTRPPDDAVEIALLRLCPNVQEYTTCLPWAVSHALFPSLPRLRSLAACGFGIHISSQDIELHTAHFTQPQNTAHLFFAKLNPDNTPSLAVIKALDLEGTTAQGVPLLNTISAVSDICRARGICFQDALEQEIVDINSV
ncbi:hypothetical protein CALVIDRAFT_543145 [Calocera viscosa TUFC12733]|uniref:F-box domain-containing protein n=1 Tax=Calocera viscosa (strain TUFC12733) TaxID=1330018 RepID=A0A167FWB7_CALVF|nr:hypothetical protein CALVIDRAFT_543145 [Calocera viscosa TUFC12733]